MSITITAEQMVRKAKMSTRPEFYSGRGAMYCDLNDTKLLIIYREIQKNIGEEQAQAFVTMIENTKSLSATNFLNRLYALESNNWEYSSNFEESDIDVGPDSPGREAVAFATIMSAFSSSGRDDTRYIRNSFFRLIGYTPESDSEEYPETDFFGYRYFGCE